MNLLVLSLFFILLSCYSDLTFAQVPNDDKERNPVTKMHLFTNPGEVKIPEFPRQKFFVFKKHGLASADFDNMPIHIPDFSKSIKMPQHKPNKKIRYTIKDFKLNGKIKP